MSVIHRHPTTSGRPTFQNIVTQLSRPDTKLLKWSKEDESVHPEADKLGADLLCGEELYKDLQLKYMYKNELLAAAEDTDYDFILS